MENELVITFHEGEIKVSELEEKINFIKNLPIKTVPSGEILSVCFSSFGLGANIYPRGQNHITYETPEKINGCDVRPHAGLLSISRKNGESEENYTFREFHQGILSELLHKNS